MEAIRKQATKLREQVARQQQVPLSLSLSPYEYNIRNYFVFKFYETLISSSISHLDPVPVISRSLTSLILSNVDALLFSILFDLFDVVFMFRKGSDWLWLLALLISVNID